MKKIKKYTQVIIGSILISFGIEVFFKGTQMLPNGILGLVNILDDKYNIYAAILLIIFNSFAFLISVIFKPKENYNKYLITALLVPIGMVIFDNIRSFIDLSSADLTLKIIFGSGIIGYGYKLIYKDSAEATGLDILEDVIFTNSLRSKRIITYIIDILIILIEYLTFGIEQAMYTIISISIIEYISKTGILNSSDTKVFYIITSEEEKVKDYIMNKLKCGLTVFDVVGGYSKTENKVLMSAIKTKDYYKLREGIKKIDKKAFITITDTYEVINAELPTAKEHR